MTSFPVYYRPRPYQRELHDMWRQNRIGVAVFPRQSGKDVAMSMEMCERRLRFPKSTGAYVSLNNPMIRDILWDKTYLDPATNQYIQALMDNVPANLVDWKATIMEGRFANKSRLKLQGYFQSGQDKNGVGTSFQDYAFTELALFTREDPLPRLMPIILNPAEDKKLMVASTPRGKRRNPLWQLMQSHENDPNFKVIVRTIDDLNEMMVRDGLPAVVPQAELERIQDSYLKRFGNDRMFEQEYYCSFEEMDAAAVYGEAYMKMVEEKRVVDFNLDPGKPVYVVFDIGASGLHSDATAWIAFQWFNNRLFIYDSGEGHGKALPEYVDDPLRPKHYFNRIAQIILPWDGDHHEKAVNTTPADMMRTKFPNVAVLAKSNKVWKIPGSRAHDADEITDIQQARLMMYNTIIHESNNQWLLECFENYKYEFNTKEQQWSQKPLHDRHSHLMDAFRYAVQATKELDFFGGDFYESTANSTRGAVDYEEDWAGVW
jgi:hypothetical protein